MTKPILRAFLTVAASLAVAAGLPLAVALFFRAEGPIVAVFAAVAVANVLFYLRRRLSRKPGASSDPRSGAGLRAISALRAGCTGLLVLAYAAAAFLLIVYIVVIPFSYYLAWLSAVGSLSHGGLIAFLFFAITAWFASLFGGLVYSQGPARPAAGAAIVALFELVVVFRTPLTVVLFTLAGVVAVALLAFRE